MYQCRIFISLFLFLIAFACKKEAGVGGKKILSGTVYFKNGANSNNDLARQAKVFITYGTTENNGEVNQTILTDNDGKYTIKGLNKGKYFLNAEYYDEHGFKYSTPGFGVNINNTKQELTLDMVLE